MIAIQYAVFFEVATHLSFSKAAEILCITQPAVSKNVKKLEAVIGIPLFERRGNLIELTGAGKKLYQHLHKAKHIEQDIFADVDIVKDQLNTRGELKVGASTTVSLYVLPKILSSFHRHFPKVKMLMMNRNSENIVKALIEKDIDLALIEAHHKINALHLQYFMEDEIIPVCSSQSQYNKPLNGIADLKNIPLVLRERGSGTLSILTEKLMEGGIRIGDLEVIARLGGTEALKNYLLEDVAVGFLSRLAVKNEIESGRLCEIQIEKFKLSRRFSFATRKGEENFSILKSFIKEAGLHYNSRL